MIKYTFEIHKLQCSTNVTNTKDNTKRESDFSDLQMCTNMDSATVENDDAPD